MTNDELKQAFINGGPVIHKTRISMELSDIEYEEISAIIYRKADGKISVSAELKDRRANSVTIVKADDVYRVSQ